MPQIDDGHIVPQLECSARTMRVIRWLKVAIEKRATLQPPLGLIWRVAPRYKPARFWQNQFKIRLDHVQIEGLQRSASSSDAEPVDLLLLSNSRQCNLDGTSSIISLFGLSLISNTTPAGYFVFSLRESIISMQNYIFIGGVDIKHNRGSAAQVGC